MSVSFADNVPHQTGRQLGGGSPTPTAVGPAPVVPPAGPTAGSMPQPGTARDLIRLAKEARDQLLGSSNAVPKALQILQSIGKPYFLHVSDQAAVGVGCGLDRAAEVVPVLCMPGSSWPNPPQPPPPFHIRRLAHERCYVLWVDPHQPWSAVARGWEKVMWALYWPNGQLVVGLPAAGSSGLLPCRPTPGLVHQPTYPTQQPACQQHNIRAQPAHEAQLVVDGAPGAAAPHPSGPGLPGGPAPLPAQQACPGPAREASPEVAPVVSAVPSPGKADGSGLAAAGTLQGQGLLDPGSGQGTTNLTQEGPDTLQGSGAMLLALKSNAPSLPPHPQLPGASSTAQGPGALPPAPGAEAQPPELQAELPGEGSGTTSADVANADVDEEEPLQPIAAGTPSGVSALTARLAGSGREDAIDLTIEEPDVKPDPGPLAAKDLVVTVVAMLDKHLPAREVPMLADAYTCMEEWLSSPHGAAQLEALRKAHAATLLKCPGMSATLVAWTLWKSIQRLLEQPLAQTPSLDAVSNEAALSPAVNSNLIHTGSSAQATAAARESKSTGSELAAKKGRSKSSSGPGHCRMSDTSDEADSDDEQDMDVMEPMSGDDAPQPTALPEVPGTAAHGQAPVAPDGAGPSSAPWPAAAPGNLAAAALVDAAGPGVDPLPHVKTWGTYSVGARCLEVVQMPIVEQLALEGAEPGSRVPILVALALELTEQPHAPGGHQGLGSLHLLCVATLSCGVKVRWRLRIDPSIHQSTVCKRTMLKVWVRDCNLQMTGRFKARRAGPEQGGPHLLVLEVRPLPQAAAQTDFTTPVCTRAAATPDQPGCSAQATAGAKPRKRGGREQDGLDGPAKRHSGLVPRVLCVGGGEADPATGQDQEGPAKEVAGAEEVPAAALTGLPTTRGGESELSSGLDFRQQPAAGAPWTPDIDATLAAAAQAGGGDAPTGRPTPCMAAGQAVPGAVQAMAPPLAAQGLPLAGLPGLPSTGGMLGKRGARYQGNHGALLPCQGMGNGPASAITTPQAGQAVPPGRQVATRSGPMSCAQIPVQQPLGTACPLSSPGLLAAPLLMPDCVRVVLNKAQQLQDLLLVSRGAANDLAMQHNVDATLLRDLDLAFLPFLSQPARPPNWNIRREGQLVVLVCVPSNGLPTLQRPPPPFLVSCLGNSVWELVWKAPDWPWGSVQQHWGKVEWVAKGPHQELVLGLQAAVSLGHVADNNSTPSSSRLHAAASPTPTPQQQEPGSEGATMVEQMEAAATEGPSSLSLPHAPACGSEAPPGQHAGNGVEGAAGRSLTASLIGPVPGVVMPPSQAALLAVPGTPGIGSPASPHSQPATPASCLYPCMAFDGGPTGNLEPTGRQQDSAQASDATDPGCPLSDVGHTSVPKPMPNSMSERVHRAEAVLQKLLHTRSEWDFALKPMSDAGSLYLLNFIAQPVPPGDWEEQDMDFVIPVVCVTHDDLSSPHQLPPPRLFMRLCDRQLELVWKQPDWPWSSVQQHWKRVVWTALTQGHMVLGLQASNNASH